jgi:hypothetical protein
MSSITVSRTRNCASDPKNERLGRENSLPVLWAQMAARGHGIALLREDKIAEGMASLKASQAYWEATGGKLGGPTMNAYFAVGMAATGDLDNALKMIDEQIVQIERPGCSATALMAGFTADATAAVRARCGPGRPADRH